jgi:hypothetical protein
MIAPSVKTAATRREGDLPPRECILTAARALFYRRGIHVVGVDERDDSHSRSAKGPLVTPDAAR